MDVCLIALRPLLDILKFNYMALQNTIGRIYAEQLQREVDSNLNLYGNETFGLDESRLLIIPGISHPEGLLGKMMSASNDFEAGIALYEAYHQLSPLQASQNSFWIYLAHSELFSYVQNRWPLVKKGGASKQYVLDHWFFSHGVVRNALAGLWWTVYCSIDEDSADDKYNYTRFLFSNYTFRAIRLGPTKLMRHKEAVIGIIRYLIDTQSQSGDNSMEDRVNYVVSYFNKLGATKQLAYLDREFFYNELRKSHSALMTFRHKKIVDEDGQEQ